MTATQAETSLEIRTLEEHDFTPECGLIRAFPFGLGQSDPCHNPATHMIVLHELDCGTGDGNACAEHIRELRQAVCPVCGAPKLIQEHPL